MTVDKLLCQSLKDRGKWVATLCHFCRCRKRCADNPDNKVEVTAGSLNDIAQKAISLGDRMLEIKGNKIEDSIVLGIDNGKEQGR